ncbi:MAG TPA: hypothetical protein VGK02_00640 [Candidatus Aquicultor sp.]|jgi:hypothetical protein
MEGNAAECRSPRVKHAEVWLGAGFDTQAGENHEYKEYGSDFHLLLTDQANDIAEQPWHKNGLLFGTGRDAFRALLTYGMKERGWRRFLVPSYFCQRVVASFLTTGIDVVAYEDNPTLPAPRCENIELKSGDVVLAVNYFGLRPATDIKAIYGNDIEVIEDHTHDPWSDWAYNSTADWCVVSLRKMLPAPDGGVLWSPAGHPMPYPTKLSDGHRQASLEKLAAMSLKGLYLNNQSINKEVFLRLARSGEAQIASGEISGISDWSGSMLNIFPTQLWRRQRRLNYQALYDVLADVSWLTMFRAEENIGSCPFSGIVVFNTPGRRAYIQQKLIDSHIYTAVLWPLENPAVKGIDQAGLDLSRRMISVYCDMRYSTKDMSYVGSRIKEIGASYRE